MFFRTRHCTRVHRLGVQKCAKLKKKGCVFGHIDKFWKGHDGQIKKNACKNAYLGSIFILEKYVIRVIFVCPWTSLIPQVVIRVPPPDIIAAGTSGWSLEARMAGLRNSAFIPRLQSRPGRMMKFYTQVSTREVSFALVSYCVTPLPKKSIFWCSGCKSGVVIRVVTIIISYTCDGNKVTFYS